MRAAVIRGNKNYARVCLNVRTCSSRLLRQDKSTRQSQRRNPTSCLQSVSFLVEEKSWSWMARALMRLSHVVTNARTKIIWCFYWSPRKWVFSLAFHTASLQHVAMATGKLLKGLTASHQSSGFHTTVFAVWKKKSTAKNYLCVCACVCVHAFRVYLRFPHRRVNASIISRFSSKREREKADMVMDEEHAWEWMRAEKTECCCLHGCSRKFSIFLTKPIHHKSVSGAFHTLFHCAHHK